MACNIQHRSHTDTFTFETPMPDSFSPIDLSIPAKRWPVPFGIRHGQLRNSLLHVLPNATDGCDLLTCDRVHLFRHRFCLDPPLQDENTVACTPWAGGGFGTSLIAKFRFSPTCLAITDHRCLAGGESGQISIVPTCVPSQSKHGWNTHDALNYRFGENIINCIAVGPLFNPKARWKEQRLAICCNENKIQLATYCRDSALETALPSLSSHPLQPFIRTPAHPNHASFSPTLHPILLVASDEPRLRLYHAHGNEVQSLFHPFKTISIPTAAANDSCFCTAWSTDGFRFAAGTQDGIVVVFELRSSEPILVLPPRSRTIPKPLQSTTPGLYPHLVSTVDVPRTAWPMPLAAASNSVENLMDTESHGPAEAIRKIEFLKRKDDQEWLVYSEQEGPLHVLDGATLDPNDMCSVKIDPEEVLQHLSSEQPHSSVCCEGVVNYRMPYASSNSNASRNFSLDTPLMDQLNVQESSAMTLFNPATMRPAESWRQVLALLPGNGSSDRESVSLPQQQESDSQNPSEPSLIHHRAIFVTPPTLNGTSQLGGFAFDLVRDKLYMANPRLGIVERSLTKPSNPTFLTVDIS